MLSSLVVSLFAYLFSLNAYFGSDNLFIQKFFPALSAVAEDRIVAVSQTAKKSLLGQEADAIFGEPELAVVVKPEENSSLKPIKLPDIKEPDITASSSVVIDNTNEIVLYSKNGDQVWPLASITKLVTAMVFLDNNSGWEEVYEIKRADRREGGKIYLFTGDRVKIKDLFYLSLVASGNTETIALVSSTGLTEVQFVERMNQKTAELGLTKTIFYDAVGLSDDNVSTPLEVAKIAKAAFSLEEIKEATLTKKYQLNTLSGRKKIVYNTDMLLDIFMPNGVSIMGGKTGYTDKAGYNFVGKFVDRSGHEVISVILGDIDKNSRFEQTHKLVEWIYSSYQW